MSGMIARFITIILLSFVAVGTLSSGSAIADIIYLVDLPPTGDLTLTGTITTDGKLGTITRADILDWDLTVYSASLSSSFEFTPLTSTLTSYSDGGRSPDFAVATATTLTLPSPDDVFNLEKANAPPYVDPYGQAVVDGAGSEYFRVETADGRYDEVEIGLLFPLQLADAGVVTPLPAALPLFATGLGAMGLIGWRRKRKALAV